MLVTRGAYIRGGLYSGGAYIRDFTVLLLADCPMPDLSITTYTLHVVCAGGTFRQGGFLFSCYV